ncbi:hypothetical protein HOP60_09890 [Halomonas daqingensis]|uniref:DnaT DNA-binding domain-containing protein n=1 Tax=Billgrantia desiderata TaxID=52021 RepID=A0ABS9B5I1_9GAMM|nr:helix-turn-helix domain-containing protein [Halomonas desiderata]MCE8042464.1 hypothetical protein [Halomonas desiderata]MCE8047039.1 hypothetical protein [Halomonas desiderata]
MSLAAMHWARQSLKTLPDSVKAPARLALMLLADYADEEHASWPSINTMALEMGCSVRSVQRAIDLLESHGLLRVENRHAKNGRQISNRYHLAVEGRHPVGRQSDTPSISDEFGEGDNLTPPEGDKLTGGGVTGDRGRVSPVSPLESTNKTLPPTPSHSGERDSHFPPNVFERAAQQTDDGQPVANTQRQHPMTLDWEPGLEVWQRACWDRGLAPDADVSEALIDFREHFAAQPGRIATPADWTRRFARWVHENLKRQQAQAAITGGATHANRRERTPARRLTAAEARERDRIARAGGGQPGDVFPGEYTARAR